MQYYAQKNYDTELGTSSLTIAEAGCLLTAFSNLLAQVGAGQEDPPTLDAWFRAHNDFINGSDLSWLSVCQYNGNVKLVSSGAGPIPPRVPAIVKFYYQSVSHPWLDPPHNTKPNMINHFCLVDHIDNNQVFIVDSYDGLIKSPREYQYAYHAPVGWATYTFAAPAPAAPAAPQAPAGAVSFPSPAGSYRVIVTLKGYTTATLAANRQNSNSLVPTGNYSIYTQKYGMINITPKPGQPGWWINPADNMQPAVPAPAAPPVPPIQANVFSVTKPVPGYPDANDAVNRINSNSTVPIGVYPIYTQKYGMLNVTPKAGTPGWWINPDDLKAPQAAAPAAPDVPTGTLVSNTTFGGPAAPAAPVKPTAPFNWKSTYKPDPKTYVALQTFTPVDLETGLPAPDPCHEYDIVPAAGTFTGPDGTTKYVRTRNSVLNNKWYGLDFDKLMVDGNLTFGDMTARHAGMLAGIIDRVQAFFSPGKKEQ